MQSIKASAVTRAFSKCVYLLLYDIHKVIRIERRSSLLTTGCP